MSHRVITAAAAALSLGAPQLAAQGTAPAPPLASLAALRPAGVHRLVTAPAVADPLPGDTTGVRRSYTPGERVVARTTLGALGFAGGVLAGAWAGIQILGRDCGCDDPGLESAIKGATVGGVLATALVVQAMPLRDGCNRPTRFALAAAGATLGTAAGNALTTFARHGGTGMGVLVIPLSGALGAAGAAGLCRA